MFLGSCVGYLNVASSPWGSRRERDDARGDASHLLLGAMRPRCLGAQTA